MYYEGQMNETNLNNSYTSASVNSRYRILLWLMKWFLKWFTKGHWKITCGLAGAKHHCKTGEVMCNTQRAKKF